MSATSSPKFSPRCKIAISAPECNSRSLTISDNLPTDPPRAGAADVIARVGACTDEVVYVSCDPMTLGRDLEQLGFAGWAQPVDMMPHTSHVEVVVSCSRRA